MSGPQFAAPVVVTDDAVRFVVAEQILALGIKGTIVLEPERRDSVVAVAVGALTVARDQSPEAVRLVLAAVHVITDVTGFVGDCLEAAKTAS